MYVPMKLFVINIKLQLIKKNTNSTLSQKKNISNIILNIFFINCPPVINRLYGLVIKLNTTIYITYLCIACGILTCLEGVCLSKVCCPC